MTEAAAPTARALAVIGAATSAGAYGPGQERAPEVFRRHGLPEALRRSGRAVEDEGTVVHATFRQHGDPRANDAETVAAAARAVAAAVGDALEAGHDVLVLGGDCTVEVGSVAGAVRDGSSVGLVYIDLDADLNTPDTGDGILDWMGVAHLLDVPGSVDDVAGSGDRRPLLGADDIVLVAVDRVTGAEQAVIDRLGVRVEPLREVRAALPAVLDRTAAWAASYDRVLVHVDADVLDFAAFPVADNTRRVPGLQLDELALLLAGLCRLPGWRCLTVCEVNPDHAEDEAATFARLVDVLRDALSGVRQAPR